MKNLLALLSMLALLACDAGSDRAPDGGDGQSGSGGGGAGGSGGGQPPACKAPGELTVHVDDEELEVERVRASGAWTALGGREVFRIQLESSHDPIPEAVDDELAIVTSIDLVPSQVLSQRGEQLAIDQQIATGFSTRRSFADDPSVEVTSAATHARVIRRVLVEQSGFGTNPSATSYHVTGELALTMTQEHRVQGTLSLSIDGRLPLAFAGEQTRIEGCFDFVAVATAACTPGEACGNDCLDEGEWPCWDCGELYLTHECACRPDLAPLEECAPGAQPAGVGELCGEQWWCDRPCADGLTCAPDPSYGSDADAGASLCEHYRTCQQP